MDEDHIIITYSGTLGTLSATWMVFVGWKGSTYLKWSSFCPRWNRMGFSIILQIEIESLQTRCAGIYFHSMEYSHIFWIEWFTEFILFANADEEYQSILFFEKILAPYIPIVVLIDGIVQLHYANKIFTRAYPLFASNLCPLCNYLTSAAVLYWLAFNGSHHLRSCKETTGLFLWSTYCWGGCK